MEHQIQNFDIVELTEDWINSGDGQGKLAEYTALGSYACAETVTFELVQEFLETVTFGLLQTLRMAEYHGLLLYYTTGEYRSQKFWQIVHIVPEFRDDAAVDLHAFLKREALDWAAYEWGNL